MTFKKKGSRIVFNVSTNGTENQNGRCRRGAFLSLTNRICKEHIMKNSAMALRALFIVIAGVVVTTLFIQAV